MHRPNPLWTISAMFALTGLMGCAARSEQVAPETPEAPMAPGQPSSIPASVSSQGEGDIDSLEAALARDEESLRSLVAVAETPPADESQPDAPSPPRPATPAATGASKAGAMELESSERPCDRACRALDSMRRSAEGICRLSGDEPDRCERAQARVDAAGDLVRGAGCSC